MAQIWSKPHLMWWTCIQMLSKPNQATDTLGHYVACAPLRFVVSVYDDSAPVDRMAVFFAFGPRVVCSEVCGVIRRAARATIAYHRVRADFRVHGVVDVCDATRLAKEELARVAGAVAGLGGFPPLAPGCPAPPLWGRRGYSRHARPFSEALITIRPPPLPSYLHGVLLTHCTSRKRTWKYA